MQIKFSDKVFQFDGSAGYLNSGEFHYFRVPHADWTRRLRLLKEMGGNAAATYIPWLMHEPEEGRFSFDAPQLNLRKFLDAAAEVGIAVIARPGPYQYSELIYDGLPPWLCKNYPRILARDRYGKILHYSAVSYLHPLFLEKAGRYFDAVCPILSEYSAVRGGPVAVAQPDNELGGVHLWRGDFDCNPETMGFGDENGRFASYLKRRFGDVAAVNLRYETRAASLAEFGPPPAPGAPGTAAMLRQRDYADFYWYGIGEYLEVLMDMMTERGVDVPFCHNSANPAMNACFREAKERLGDRILLGSDHYYSLDQRWPQNNPTPQYAIRCFLSLEELRLMGNPPSVLEFPYGSLSEWPPISSADLEACAMMHLGFGMRGHNGYVFTGGPNIPGTGSTTDIYDYNAPVDASGEPRPSYYALKNYGDYVKAHPHICTSLPDSDFRVLMPWRLCRADDRWGGVAVPGTVGEVKSWNDFMTGLLTSSFAAGLFPEMVDPDSGDWVSATDKPLVVWTNGTLNAAVQRRLVEFMRNGGSVLCVPVIPRHDEDFRPCTVLADYLGGAASGEAVSPSAAQTRFNVAGVVNVYGNGDHYPASAIPAGAEIIGVDEYSGRTVAWQSGGFIFLGMSWCHGKAEQAQMVGNLLDRLGMRRRIISSDSWVIAVMRTHAAGSTLFVMNLGSSRRVATIQARPGGVGGFLPPETLTLPPMTVIAREMP